MNEKEFREVREIIKNEKTEALVNELESIRAEIQELETSGAIMSAGHECYGFKEKTAQEMKEDILYIINTHIEEVFK